MHYKNGREAKAGDRVINLATGESGLLHSTNSQSTTCNGRLAEIRNSDQWVTIGDCVHFDDLTFKPAEAATEPPAAK